MTSSVNAMILCSVSRLIELLKEMADASRCGAQEAPAAQIVYSLLIFNRK